MKLTFRIAGIGSLLICFALCIWQGWYLLHSETISAVTVDNALMQAGPPAVYLPIVRYRTSSGHSYDVTLASKYRQPVAVGTTYPVRYETAHPGQGKQDFGWTFFAICFVLGPLLALSFTLVAREM
jgi:hypothetical protein